MNKCKKCGDIYFHEKCNCRPYLVFHTEWLGDAPEVLYAESPQAAAIRFVSSWESECRYYGTLEESEKVIIAEPEGGDKHHLSISSQPTIEYEATPIPQGK